MRAMALKRLGSIRPGCQRAKEPRASEQGSLWAQGPGTVGAPGRLCQDPRGPGVPRRLGVDPLAPRAIRTDGPSVLSAVDL